MIISSCRLAHITRRDLVVDLGSGEHVSGLSAHVLPDGPRRYGCLPWRSGGAVCCTW